MNISTQLYKAVLPHNLLCKPRQIVGANIFMVDKNEILFIVDYYSKFPVVKKLASLTACDMVQTVKIAFAEFVLPRKHCV